MAKGLNKNILYRWIFVGILLGLVLISISLGLLLLKLPSVASLKNFRPPVASEVFSEDYVKIGEFYRERRIFRPLAQIPPYVIHAFLDAEDDQFFHHKGISFSGIFRAMVKNMLAGEVKQGGSTITQQVAKALLLSPERSLIRKAKEAVLAFKMESYLTKEEILEIYLNQVYLGHGAYGVQAAAQTYFGKNLVDLLVPEIAMMAGLTKAPSRDNPHTNPERAHERQVYVLDRMHSENHISKEEFDSARNHFPVLAVETDQNRRFAPYFVEHVRRYISEKYGESLVLEGGLQIYTTLSAKAALASQLAIARGLEEVDRHQGYRGPLENISKTNRPNFLQKLKESMGDKSLKSAQNYKALVMEVSDTEKLVYVSLGSRSGVIPFEEMRWARKPNADKYWENDLIDRPSQALKVGDVIWVRLLENRISEKRSTPKDSVPLMLAQDPVVQGALIALDPNNGAIRAMVGGYDFEKSEFNRAVQARRQPGSSFKPILYAAALDRGFTPASMILDSPMVYDDPTTELRWKPKNFGGQFHGDTIFRDCLIESRNVPTIKIVQDIGLDTVIDYAQKLGIRSPLSRDLSLALGSSAVTPMELVSAYTTFASGGKRVEPLAIRKIVDRDGVILERNALDDPALDWVEQAAIAQQQTLTLAAQHQAIESGRDPKAPLPPGYSLSPQTSYIMTHLLKEVIHFGTGRRAQALERPAAGKTGTTNDNYDAWFIGFTPNLVAGIWLGFDDAGTLGAREEGGRAASPIWLDFMKDALEGSPVLDFSVPSGIVFAQIDTKTGKLATSKTKGAVFEAFREGTEPKETTEESQTKKSSQQFYLQE